MQSFGSYARTYVYNIDWYFLSKRYWFRKFLKSIIFNNTNKLNRTTGMMISHTQQIFFKQSSYISCIIQSPPFGRSCWIKTISIRNTFRTSKSRTKDTRKVQWNLIFKFLSCYSYFYYYVVVLCCFGLQSVL